MNVTTMIMVAAVFPFAWLLSTLRDRWNDQAGYALVQEAGDDAPRVVSQPFED